MELDAADFGSTELPLHPDVVDVVAGDHAEDGPHAAADSRLFATVDRVVPNNVRADLLLRPAVPQGPLDGLIVLISGGLLACPRDRDTCPV